MSGIATYPVGSSWNFGQHPKLLLFNYLNIESPRIFCFISLLYREPLRLSSYSLRVLHSLIEAAIAWLQLPSHRSPHIYHPFCPVHFPTVTREHSNSEHSNSMIHSFRQFLRSSQRSGLIWGIGGAGLESVAWTCIPLTSLCDFGTSYLSNLCLSSLLF